MDLASVVAALASVGVRVSGSTPNNNIQGDSSRACPTGLAGPEPSGTHNDPGQHFHPRGHLGVTWGVYLCAGKPPLADIILSRPPELTRCDSVIGLAIPAMSGHIQNRGTASGDLYIGISGINRVLLS